ncbi:MAG: amino acid adenylation domain-containing protein [Phenylobacterium sp.]|jgi:amino acid adenylation domain-containing protein
MQDVNSIIECLYRNSIAKPDEIAYEFVTSLASATETVTYHQLYTDVSQMAKSLLDNVAAGDCVLLLYPPSIEYIKAFFACVMAGVVAIPLYPPKKNSKSDKVFIVARASKAKFALTSDKELALISAFWAQNADIEMHFSSTQALIEAQTNRPTSLPDVARDNPAFLQYTSGSTGDPKGVIITHGNILANTQYLHGISGADDRDIFVNWLPLFHDLGLVTAILLPAYMGCKSVLMAPATFVRDPVIWLKAITVFGGTIGGAPNFAYDLCTDKIADSDLAEVDLSKWRIAYNAAEPVKYDTISRFAARFAANGFNRDCFYPSYGMAESTAFMTGGHGNDKLAVISIDKNALADHKVSIVASENNHKIDFVGNGLTDANHHLKIVNAKTLEVLPDGEIGEVWFTGPSVSPGYWLLDQVSKQAFGNTLQPNDGKHYLQTGDLGFISKQHLYVTGRSKDMIILKGKNYYPQDIEATIKYCHDDVHSGYTAAFEVDEKLVVVTEISRRALKTLDPRALVQQIGRSVYTQHSISVDDVVLLPPYKIPMTSSGKIRRSQTKQLYQAGKLASLYQKVSGEDTIKPTGEVENAVHAIWSRVLDMADICVNRGFFELGGDSIKATEISAAVAAQYQSLALDENKMLECVSIKEMAQFVSLSLMKSAEPLFASKVIADHYVAPVSNLQRNIYFLESLSDGQSFYNVPVAFDLKGEIDQQALSLAIATLCQQFHILRTVYRYNGDELQQIVEAFDPQKVPFEVVSIGADELEQGLENEANHCFDLSQQWPIRARLFNAGSTQVLSLVMHHIAIDGYSAKLITAALSEAYRLHLASSQHGQLVGAVFGAPQYGDYAFWHQDYLASSACQQARSHWQRLLKDAPSCHNFPLEFARPSTLSVAGDVVFHDIKGAAFEQIKAAAQQKNSSVFLLLQSLFAGFMARYGDEEDLLISSVYANRTPSVFSNTIGMFANTIPFRYRLDENTDIDHLVNSTTEQHHQALQHQQFPFELMLEGLTIERDSSYNPLVQVQFVLQQDSLNDFSLDGLDVEVVNNRQRVAKFDFSVHITINEDKINIGWEFNTNLFSRERLKTMLDHLLMFIDHHVANEFDKVLCYQFDDKSSANEVVKSNFKPYIANPQLIEQYATSQPDAIAVIEGAKTLDYAALIANGNRLIAGLQQRGIKFGERVAVYMDKSIEQVIAMYAVMRAGYIYVPLDPSYPQERLAYICQNADAKALVHAADFIPSADIAGSIPLAAFESLVSDGSVGNSVAELANLTEDHPAYIIYTSGSTGKPKGVMVPHGSIYYSLQANRKVYDFVAEDIMPTVGSQAFGVSLLETFVPLICGGTVQSLTKPEVADIAKLIDTTQQVTVMHMVPSLMAQWLDQIETSPKLYPQLRLLLVGAEPVPPILLTRLKAWRDDVVVRVLYGMTESSVVSSGYLSHEHDGNGYSVGKPHPNMRFHTMNRFGIPQPVGVPGELYVGGLSLAAGYVGLPELTAKQFVEHKLLNERLYKTGDRARLLPSGHFEFLGRVDHQVSLRGIRIETGEIESLVNQIDEIKKCIAHVVPLDNGDSKFVLYYTQYGDADKAVIEASIKAVMAKDIPESMRPSILVQLADFPHNPNGKVDRKKLPKPTSDAQVVAPSTATQQYLHDLWCTMLELDQISIEDSFFELGGHSLMATKLVNKINEHYAISLGLRQFFEASTIGDSAAVIDEEVDKCQLSQLVVSAENTQVNGEIDEFVI